MQGRALIVAAVSMAFCAGAWAGTEGVSSTFYGLGAGLAASPAAGESTFVGAGAGQSATVAAFANVFVGNYAGRSVTTAFGNTLLGTNAGTYVTGGSNTMVGRDAGGLAVGELNVFLGNGAGYAETGSHKLYIDNCGSGGYCTQPLIYGEFDNRLLAVDGVMHLTANRDAGDVKSQLHFSVNGADEGGWLTSAAENNLFTSSGARYDAAAGGWIQRSSDGKAVIAGSGGVGFRVLTSSGGAVGGVVVPVSRLHIDYDGLMGVNAAPMAGRAINTSTGAYLSSGGVWTNASSRALKDDIQELSAERALEAFRDLKPVTFRYTEETAGHVGFIAEDVPALVATADRKGLSPMDVVAVLTKVVQEKSRVIDQQASEIALLKSQSARLAGLEARLEALAAEMGRNR